ncbi:2-acylglycerol O-acyltransferase 1-like [Sitophilus oryzae]|uniref:Acyltransferase n=1 Tax=Sitophilus oryzae TaxID=7048 RepID=A0A6J2XND8_SITOR|nr:2-acylglycerol O-acyltransferase 1-like [Sitophilus oryzae]XP_030752582.1 2-acylglycerol O-acyltransferase 1-like [Sitophilus oryzae]XP_030752583.1 2-acylglycerol O-acyltransferase 1-like [Sitophilus oryzae]
MEFAGIKFAPLNVSLDRRLQTLAAACGFIWLIFGGFICLIFSVYLVLFTKYWLVTSVYLLWVLWDLKTSETGGRPSKWVRNWRWWYYMKEYFPARMERLPWVQLDKNKNYLFCCFPHGMLSLGVFCNFASDYGEFKIYFPHHSPRVVTLSQHYIMPFFREMGLALGGISAEANAIEYVLRKPGGGNVCVLMPGGAQESYYCKPGQYRIILKQRRGFIKLALRNGAPLVPVLSFGETDTFDQVEGSTLRKIQETLRKMIGIAPVVPVGRGFFQYSFGLVPRRKRIVVVVGKPLDIPKIDNPNHEQIEEYHSKFVVHLKEMFDEQKYNYLEDPEHTELIIE